MRRILTEIKLEKVAAVSSPAQEGALALIMKTGNPNHDELGRFSSGEGGSQRVQQIEQAVRAGKSASEIIHELGITSAGYGDDKKNLSVELSRHGMPATQIFELLQRLAKRKQEVAKVSFLDAKTRWANQVQADARQKPSKDNYEDEEDQLGNEIDDWSQKSPRKQPKPWSRTEIDQVNDTVNKQRKTEHPFMRRARALSQQHNVPLYLGMSAARREDPASHRHFVQSGVEASQPKPIRKSVADDAVIAWDQAVYTWGETHGMSRCDAMMQIRKQAPSLWQRYRRS